MFVGGKDAPYLAEKYEEARALRRDGVAIKRIATRLGVSPGSVHRWTTDIELTPEQRSDLEGSVHARRAESCRRTWRERRLRFQEEGRARAREGGALHQAGCMLYWAEGANDRNALIFANSEPAMVAFFKRFLIESFGVSQDRFRMRLNVYLGNGFTIEEVEHAWLDALELPRGCIQKHTIDHMPTSSSGKRTRKLPYGVCTLKVSRSTAIVQHIFGAIQEYAGFEAPDWLG